LDEDGFPEFGVKSTGYTYILKYIPKQNEFIVLLRGPTMYYTILGARQLGYHDGLHAGVVRDRYIILNDKYDWEIVLDLQQGTQTPLFYEVGTFRHSEILWHNNFADQQKSIQSQTAAQLCWAVFFRG